MSTLSALRRKFWNTERWRHCGPLGVILIFVAAMGADRRPADPHTPLNFDGTPEVVELPRGVIRIGTFNIHGLEGPDGVRDLERTAATLNALDIVALQEVRDLPFDGHDDQATELGRALGMASLFVPTERRWWRDHLGNGLLTRVEMTGARVVPLHNTRGKGFRNAVLAEFRHEGRTVHVLATHLDNADDHDVQFAAVADLFLSLPQPAILIGDLNARVDDPQLQQLMTHPSVTCVVGEKWGENEPLRGLDWIIARGLRCVDYECRDHGASDHAAVCATLEIMLPPPRSSTAPATRAASTSGPSGSGRRASCPRCS